MFYDIPNFNAANSPYVHIQYKNDSASQGAQLFFITEQDQTWDEAKSIIFPVTANDTGFTEYVLDLSAITGWTGIIKQIRFDPSFAFSGTFTIDNIRFSSIQ